MSTKEPGNGWSDDFVFDEEFVKAAPVQENAPLPKPTRESLREVKREARERKRAARRPAKPPKPPKGPKPPRASTGRGSARLWLAVFPAALLAVAAYLYFGVSPNAPGLLSQDADMSMGDIWVDHKASQWAVASDGIELPTAERIGKFSEDDVRTALIASRDFVEAVTVDRSVVFGERVQPALRTLSDGQEISSYYGSTRTSKSWPYLMTRFPKEALLPADDTIRYRGFMKPVLRDGTLTVDFSYATAYALEEAEGSSTAEIVIVRREGTLEFGQAEPGQIGLPSAGRMHHVSDHSVCGSRWPFKAFTQAWLGRVPEPDLSPTASNQPTFDPNERHDLTDPDDSIRQIDSCFTDTSSER